MQQPAPDMVRTVSLRRLSTPIRKSAEFIFAAIGPTIRIKTFDPPFRPINWAMVSGLLLSASIGILAIAMAQGCGRRGETSATLLFVVGILALFQPTVTRLAWPTTSPMERMILLVLLGIFSYATKLLYAPTAFVNFDEFLHWRTASDILESGRLFRQNPLLLVSPLFPGLEILTSAVASLTGLSIFPASVVTFIVLRCLFICALFTLYHKVCGSYHIAAIGCLVYIGNSNYFLFHSMFAYESLAIVLFGLVLVTFESRKLVLTALLLAALAVTHHLTAYFASMFLITLVVLEFLGGLNTAGQRINIILVPTAVVAVALPLVWSSLMGNPSEGYLGPVIADGITEFIDLLTGASSVRAFFVAADGSQTPVGQQLVAIASTAIVSLALATGFFRSLALSSSPEGGWRALAGLFVCRWRNSSLLLLTLITLAFPLSIALRLTSTGWELGNRTEPFIFFGVGIVVAVSIVHYWQPFASWWRAIAVSVVLMIVISGGIIKGFGPFLVRGTYRVVDDALSVEAMGVETALWSRTWLGEHNKFDSDRINRVLLATYGRQDIVTGPLGQSDPSDIFFNKIFSDFELAAMKEGKIDYLLIDLRLTQSLPVMGHYFEAGEPNEAHAAPPAGMALLKFDDLDGVSRVYDNGWIVIFDMRSLYDRG